MQVCANRIGRIRNLLWICFWFASFNPIFAQNIPTKISEKLVSVNLQKAKPQLVLQTISEQTGLVFSYKSSIWDGVKPLTLNLDKRPLKEVFQLIFPQNSIAWSFIEPDILVLRKVRILPKNQFIYTGFVQDSISGEKLLEAHILYQEGRKVFATNSEGFFSIQSGLDSITLKVSYMGYESKVFKIGWKNNQEVYLSLSPMIFLAPANVSASNDQGSLSGETGREITLKSWQITELSPLFGESDVFRTLQLLPGVQSVGEGTPGLYVRGGSPDQNLVLLDGTPVYNPVHIFGFYSVFNPGIVKSVNLKKGPFPAQFGGRLSSIIDIQVKDGNKNKHGGEVGVGLIGSRISLDGPLNKLGKTTYLISARRSQLDLLLSPFFDANLSTQNTGFLSAYYFYDLNTKIVHRFNKKNKLVLSAYMGQDRVSLNNSFSLKSTQREIQENDRQQFTWGNMIVSAKWDKILSNKAVLKTSSWFSNYEFGNRSIYSFTNKASSDTSELFYDYSFNSRIFDIGVRAELNYYLSNKWLLIAGGQSVNHNFQPGVSSLSGNLPNIEQVKSVDKSNVGIENAFFLENEIKLTPNTELNAGLHFSHFYVDGANYIKPQPRLSITQKFTRKLSLSFGYAQMQQFMHLLTNSSIGIPNDLWILTSRNLAPQESSQFNANVKFNEKTWSLGVDVFSKIMSNVIEYKDGANFLRVTDNWESKITTGIGEVIGLELFAEKKFGKFNGWLGYCLSKNTRTFDEINDGKPFLFRHDRRHDLSASFSYQPNQRNLISINFVYASGTPITLPEQIYPGVQIDGSFVDVFVQGRRNNFTLPDYHRLDLNYSNFKFNRWGKRVWAIGFYNMYNRQNPFFITPAYNDSGQRILRQISLFPLIPSITYRQEF